MNGLTRRRIGLLLTVGFIVCALPAIGQRSDGAVVVRISDGAENHCIDPKVESVWLSLRRLVTQKRQSWFTKDSEVGVLLKTTISEEGNDKSFQFPTLAHVGIADYNAGQVSVPIEYGLIRSFKLRQVGRSYSGFGVEITLLNRKGRNAWGTALEALAGLAGSGKVTLPTNPATAAATYLLDFANNAVKAEVAAQDPADAPLVASLDIAFDPSGKCNGDLFQHTGTIAVLWDRGLDNNQRVRIGETQKYCWRADGGQVFRLQAAMKPSDEDCKKASGWFDVSNDYLGMIINAVPTGSLGPGSDSPQTREAIARCKFNGIEDAKECLRE